MTAHEFATAYAMRSVRKAPRRRAVQPMFGEVVDTATVVGHDDLGHLVVRVETDAEHRNVGTNHVVTFAPGVTMARTDRAFLWCIDVEDVELSSSQSTSRPVEVDRFPHVCQLCGGRAYVGFTSVEHEGGTCG